MKDFLWKYKKEKTKTNVKIVIFSLVLAFAINFLIFDKSSVSSSLKASILDSSGKQVLADLYLTKSWENIVLKSTKSIENIEKLTASINYDPGNLSIENIESKIEWIKIKSDNSWSLNNIWLSNTPWINSLIIEFTKNNNISIWDEIISITTKKKVEKTENINLINADFTTKKWEVFLFSTSWVSF